MAIFLVNRSDLHNFLTDFEQESDLRIVITFSHLRALHDALRETFLKVTNIKLNC